MQPICPDDFITEQNELILYPKEQKHKTIYGEKDWLTTSKLLVNYKLIG